MHKSDTPAPSGSWMQIVRTIALGIIIVAAYRLLR